jgi:protoheme IX farnesyltransferase
MEPGLRDARHGSQPRAPGPLSDYLALTKPGITGMVLLTAAAGYALGSDGVLDWAQLAGLLAGTALVAGGTNALNQWWERATDARMPRTKHRPLAAGRLSPTAALLFALGIGTLGVALLAVWTNLLTAMLAALTLCSYVLAYTPLKRQTTWNTLVGCVPGALPIVGGWTAATGTTDPGAWTLFLLLYLWQVPHTLALAWLYRDDYRAGGLVMPGHDDPMGRATALKAAAWTLLLLGAGLLPAALEVTRPLHLAVAATAGLALLVVNLGWVRTPSRATARRLFLATLGYLPVVLGLGVGLKE